MGFRLYNNSNPDGIGASGPINLPGGGQILPDDWWREPVPVPDAANKKLIGFSANANGSNP